MQHVHYILDWGDKILLNPNRLISISFVHDRSWRCEVSHLDAWYPYCDSSLMPIDITHGHNRNYFVSNKAKNWISMCDSHTVTESMSRHIAKISKTISSVIRQKGNSQNRGNKKTKHAKFSEKQRFIFVFLLPPFWDLSFCLIADDLK